MLNLHRQIYLIQNLPISTMYIMFISKQCNWLIENLGYHKLSCLWIYSLRHIHGLRLERGALRARATAAAETWAGPSPSWAFPASPPWSWRANPTGLSQSWYWRSTSEFSVLRHTCLNPPTPLQTIYFFISMHAFIFSIFFCSQWINANKLIDWLKSSLTSNAFR